ncbi:cell division cycle-associated 7-like protein [Glandiceps talaboti]
MESEITKAVDSNNEVRMEEEASDCESDVEETMDYEKKRQLNIQENKVMLNKLLAELKKIPGLLPIKKDSPKKTKSKRSFPYEMVEKRRNPARSARPSVIARPYPTRARTKRERDENDGDEEEMESPRKGQKLFIKLKSSLFKFKQDGEKNDDDDDDWFIEEDEHPRRRMQKVVEVKSAEEITEEDLDLVANSVKDKSYDSISGSSCHQCRQKTDDMKTMCRSGYCIGIRGQFCGPCLRNRYGEDAKEALKDPNWVCPPCRGVCNCSFCRKKAGRHATGILIHLARQSGYDNVKTYLDSFKA